jgi:hypothetical protein
MRHIILNTLLVVALAGCSSSSGESNAGAAGSGGDHGGGGADGTGGAGGEVGGIPFDATWSHKFPSIFVPAGEEKDYDCQSWTLDNDEPIYITGVRQTNDGAWHHSNWFFVPEDRFGDDGTWDCRDENFDMVSAGVFGGVVFAQSTQSLEEVFRFPEGSAVVIPPRSKIVGALHLVNIAAGSIDTSITLEFETAERDDVNVALQPLSYLIYSLAIPPQQESRWRMTCPMDRAYDILGDRAGEFSIHYVLGHYHSWGNYFALDYVYEDGSTRNIIELESVIGDSLGRVVDPPVFADGAAGLKVTCGYNNTTDAPLVWGNNAEDEMCMFLAYVGAPVKVVSWGSQPSEELGMVDGYRTYEAGCGTVTAVAVSGLPD